MKIYKKEDDFMIPLAVPNLTGNEKIYLDHCIDTTYVSSVGEYVVRLEKMAEDETGSAFAVATSAGTTGLHAALTAAGVGMGDLVILPTFTLQMPWHIAVQYLGSWILTALGVWMQRQ